MPRPWPWALVVGMAVAALAAAQSADEKTALALEKTVQQAIARVEPSVACLVVSRSDYYARVGQPPTDAARLGDFNRAQAALHPLVQRLSPVDRKALLDKLDLADATLQHEASASGVVLSEDGLVLTPCHAIEDATRIYVQLAQGTGGYADIVAADPRSDLAILKVRGPGLKGQPIRFADAPAERGQFVVGVAWNDRNARPAAAWGIISNLRQRVPAALVGEERNKTIHHYGSLLQTDARCHLGSTGAVLVNLRGEAVGLVNQLAGVAGPDAVGCYAIPLEPGLLRILATLKRGEEVDYGFLGVSFEPGKGGGAVLRSVTDGSPADLAGLKAGHAIVAVDKEPIAHNEELLRALATRLAGEKVVLEFRKAGSGSTDKVEVVLAKYLVAGKTLSTSPGNRPWFRGLRVDQASLVAQQPNFTTGPIPPGVLITEVEPGSAAAKADLKPGFVITHVNDRAIATPAAFYQIVRDLKGRADLTLHVSEPGQAAPKVILP